jgi:hypothetical protein
VFQRLLSKILFFEIVCVSELSPSQYSKGFSKTLREKFVLVLLQIMSFLIAQFSEEPEQGQSPSG